MRTKRFLVGSAFGVFAVAAWAYSCGGYGEQKTITVKVDAGVQAAIIPSTKASTAPIGRAPSQHGIGPKPVPAATID